MSFDRTKPEIEFPGDTPPSDLVVEDQIVGEGATAVAGSTEVTHYVGVAHSTGEEFDASWNRGEPLSFQLGADLGGGRSIQGLQGMRVGGRRTITIPPHLGYGDRGAGAAIKGGETLIFVVDLVDVR
jgi:peptidylprolyl isomerase